jgi:hypothetical protein
MFQGPVVANQALTIRKVLITVQNGAEKVQKCFPLLNHGWQDGDF